MKTFATYDCNMFFRFFFNFFTHHEGLNMAAWHLFCCTSVCHFLLEIGILTLIYCSPFLELWASKKMVLLGLIFNLFMDMIILRLCGNKAKTWHDQVVFHHSTTASAYVLLFNYDGSSNYQRMLERNIWKLGR